MSFYFEKSAYNVLHITHTKNYTTLFSIIWHKIIKWYNTTYRGGYVWILVVKNI